MSFMSAMAADVEFTAWLGKKLTELNTDEGVFGAYIEGILTSNETAEEKSEALQSILSGIIDNENDITKACNEILDMWLKFKLKEPPPVASSSDDVDAKLVKLLESQALATVKQKQYTEEEKKIREAILSQYSQMTDDEEEGDEPSHSTSDTKAAGGGGGGGDLLEKNTNAMAVAQAEKEKREQARLESQRKKDKDKEDREKQKQQREEKKEKRKTQKGERRR